MVHFFFTVESGILGFGNRKTAQEIRNHTNDWNPEHESGIRTESKTVLDSLTRGDLYLSSLGLPLPRKDHKKMHS